MKIRIHPQGASIYLAALAAGVAFASFRGGPVSYAWLFAVLLLLPLSALYLYANCRFLSVYQEIEVHRLVCGEDHKYLAKIENAGPLPIHKMRLRTWNDRCNLYEIADGQELSLGIREMAELRSGISCIYAGSYDIGIKRVTLTDPFSVFTVELDVPYTFRAVVSPQITDIADTVLDLENLFNSTGLKSNRLPEETPGSDLRPYRQGDPLSSINWKVSARLSEWVVRVPDKMDKRTVTILIEAAYVPDQLQDLSFLRKRDYFLEFIVSAAWHFGKQGVPVRLIYPAGKVSEATVDSYESFLDFYNVAADGIFYYSERKFEQIRDLAASVRSVYDKDTWILIREDPGPGESHCIIGG